MKSFHINLIIHNTNLLHSCKKLDFIVISQSYGLQSTASFEKIVFPPKFKEKKRQRNDLIVPINKKLISLVSYNFYKAAYQEKDVRGNLNANPIFGPTMKLEDNVYRYRVIRYDFRSAPRKASMLESTWLDADSSGSYVPPFSRKNQHTQKKRYLVPLMSFTSQIKYNSFTQPSMIKHNLLKRAVLDLLHLLLYSNSSLMEIYSYIFDT